MNLKIGASLACVDQLNLTKEIDNLIDAGIDFIHIDIMDGVFVNNYCFGSQLFKYLKKYKNIEIEVHLMVIEPFFKIDFFKNEYLNKISFHVEACKNPLQTLNKIKSMGKECGIAINAATNEKSIYYLIDHIDYILVMAVEAGFTGQSFVKSTVEKVKNIRQMLIKRNYNLDIYIDGHVDKDTIKKLYKVGANAFVGGTTGLFKENVSVYESLKVLKNSCS